MGRVLIVPAVVSALAFASGAGAVDYVYTAKTQTAITTPGPVTAGSLTWTCSSTACTITGPWATPGVGACAALAQKVGRITEYGHPGAQLNAEQLANCNANVPGTVLQIDPSVLRDARVLRNIPQVSLPGPVISQIPANPSPPAPMPVTPPPPARETSEGFELIRQDASRPQDARLYIKTPSFAFHGISPAREGPPPGARWDGNVLRMGAITHIAADDPREVETPRSYSAPVSAARTADHYVEIDVRFENLPQRATSLEIGCSLSTAPLSSPAPFAAQNKIMRTATNFSIRIPEDRNLVRTVRVPLWSAVMADPSAVRSAACSSHMAFLRVGGGGVDRIAVVQAANPSHARFVPGMATAPGTTTVWEVKHDVAP